MLPMLASTTAGLSYPLGVSKLLGIYGMLSTAMKPSSLKRLACGLRAAHYQGVKALKASSKSSLLTVSCAIVAKNILYGNKVLLTRAWGEHLKLRSLADGTLIQMILSRGTYHLTSVVTAQWV